MSDIPWWSVGYPFRRELVIDPLIEDPFLAGNPISFTWIKQKTLGQNKILADFSNIEVLYTPDLGLTWTLLGRKIEQTATDFTLSFGAVTDITQITPAQYFVYFGNFFLDSPPVRPIYNDYEWPISIMSDGEGITYVHPGEEWIGGVASKTGAQAAFTFYGTKIHVLSVLNPSSGILRFQLDHDPAEEISLFSTAATTEQEVYAAAALSVNLHTLKMTCTGKKSAPALANRVNITKVEYQRYVKVTDTGEELLPTLAWSSAVVGG